MDLGILDVLQVPTTLMQPSFLLILHILMLFVFFTLLILILPHVISCHVISIDLRKSRETSI